MNKTSSTILFLLTFCSSLFSQDLNKLFPGHDTINIDEFLITKRNRIKTVNQYDNLIIYSKISDSSNLIKRKRGDFFNLRGDSLILDVQHFNERRMFGLIDPDGRYPVIMVHNIKKILKQREAFSRITGVGIGLSIFSTLIVSPLVCLQKSGFNGDRYIKVAGTSLAASIFFITVRHFFSHKRMRIDKKSNSWKVQKSNSWYVG